MAIFKCPECGGECSNEVTNCIHCGYPFSELNVSKNSLPDANVKKEYTPLSNKRIIGIITCFIAVICIIKGIGKVTSEPYNFYKEHLEECIENYGEVKSLSRKSSIYIAGTYEWLADNYEEMIASDKKNIWRLRVQAIAYCSGGSILFLIGTSNIKKSGELDGSDKLS